jgi:hypothetical protein
MNIVVFSKDRSCQLELFLRSMKEYFKEYDQYTINVLYKTSNSFFQNGYDILIDEYKEVNFLFEMSFKSDLISLIDLNKEYTIFFVDDIIWKESFSIFCDEFERFKFDKNILTFSLRLNTNLKYCYAASVNMKPTMSTIFDWRGLQGDYGYPMSLDGHFFRTIEIMVYLRELQYNNPNQLEAMMASCPINKPKMICCEKSIIFNNPCNKVQTNNSNKHGNITAEYLNQEFLKGCRIDLNPYRGLNNESCHKEMPVNLLKNN